MHPVFHQIYKLIVAADEILFFHSGAAVQLQSEAEKVT